MSGNSGRALKSERPVASIAVVIAIAISAPPTAIFGRPSLDRVKVLPVGVAATYARPRMRVSPSGGLTDSGELHLSFLMTSPNLRGA